MSLQDQNRLDPKRQSWTSEDGNIRQVNVVFNI